jgi:hypothetical protein
VAVLDPQLADGADDADVRLGAAIGFCAAPKTKPHRRALCEQPLVLRLQHAAVFSEMDRLKAALIELAGDASDGFREVFVAGQVTVSRESGSCF